MLPRFLELERKGIVWKVPSRESEIETKFNDGIPRNRAVVI